MSIPEFRNLLHLLIHQVMYVPLLIVYLFTLLTVMRNFVIGSIDERQLYTDLLTNYNVLERPVSNSSAPLIIKMRLFLQQIVDVDEKNQVIQINAWIRYVSFISFSFSNY